MRCHCYIWKVCVSAGGPLAIMQRNALLSMFSTLYFELCCHYKVENIDNNAFCYIHKELNKCV